MESHMKEPYKIPSIMESGSIPTSKAQDYKREKRLVKLAKEILKEHEQSHKYDVVFDKILKLKPDVQEDILKSLDGTDDLKIILKLARK